MKKLRKSLCILLCLAFALALMGCDAGGKERFTVTLTGYFDTVTTIVGYARDQKAFDDEVDKITNDLAIIHQLFDIYNSYKEFNNLKTINDGAGNTKPVEVDHVVVDLLLRAKEAHALTGGAVNVAMGSVTSIWNEYIGKGMEDPTFSELPDMETLEEAGKHTDIEDVIIDESNNTVYLNDPKMSLDAGAFAKGYAARYVTYLVKTRGNIKSLLINIGGTVASVGTKIDGAAWEIGVQDPRVESESVFTIPIDGSNTVVTSGDYYRYYTVDGVNYHHIIDPKTLMPVRGTASVTVVCDDAFKGDYLATAFMVMPMREARDLADAAENLEAAWITEDGLCVGTAGFNPYIDFD